MKYVLKRFHGNLVISVVYFAIFTYRKYPNLVRYQVEIISDPNYLVHILFERSFSRHLI